MKCFDKFHMILNCMFFILHENLIPRFFCIMSIRNDIKHPKPLFLINRKFHKLSENNCEISKSAQVRLAILQYFILSSRLITNLQQCYSFSSQHSQMHKHFLCTPGVAGVWLSLFSQQKSYIQKIVFWFIGSTHHLILYHTVQNFQD